jgi:hypothetical protein
MPDIIDHIAQRGDLAHLALLVFASAGWGAFVMSFRELARANRRFERSCGSSRGSTAGSWGTENAAGCRHHHPHLCRGARRAGGEGALISSSSGLTGGPIKAVPPRVDPRVKPEDDGSNCRLTLRLSFNHRRRFWIAGSGPAMTEGRVLE